MCCCTNYQDVFTWIGAIIINIAFVTIITISSEQNTWIGVVVSMLYTFVLYKLAQYFEDKKKASTAQIFLTDVQSQNESNVTDEIATNDVQQQSTSTASQLIVSLFYGLSILAVGVTGVLIAISLFPDSCDENDDQDYEECQKAFIRKQALINTFITIFPIMAASVYLWSQKSIPSSGVTMYFAITLLGSAVIAFFDPYWNSEWAGTCYKWWILLTSLAWTLLLSYQYIVTNDTSKKNSYSWGINIGALAFYGIMFVMVEIEKDTFWNWFLINLLSFIPLILLGLVVEHNFIIFLGVFGLLLDIWRIASDMAVVLQFVVLGIAGVGVVALGSWLKSNQDLVREPCLRMILGGDESLIAGYQNASANGTYLTNSADTTETIMCCGDSQEIFTWIGAFIVNIAFVTIISVTVETNIIVGFLLCIVYTMILFKMAQYFGNKNNDERSELNMANNQNGTNVNNMGSGGENSVSTVEGLFYGLSILALGTSGLLLSLAVNRSDDHATFIRRQAILNIFVTIVPMFLVSAKLWKEKYIPSSGVIIYLSIILLGAAFVHTVHPEVINIFENPFFKVWVVLTSLSWTMTLSYKYLCSNNESSSNEHQSYSWGINFGALVFFGIMFEVVKIQNDTFWNWLLLNLFSFIPLVLLGIIIDHNFIVFLGVLGLFIDVTRLTSIVSDKLMLQFVLLGVAGLGVVALGSWLKSNQDTIREPCLELLQLKGNPTTSMPPSSLSGGLSTITEKPSLEKKQDEQQQQHYGSLNEESVV